jgi:hypothetical protein
MKGTIMNRMMKQTLALGISGALAIAAASPSVAAPVPSNSAAVKAAAPAAVTDVRYFRHRGFGPGAVVGGLALGLAGAALAAPYYYGPGYAYDYGPDYYGYDYAPGYYSYGYGPSWGWGGRWHHHHHHW